VYGLSVEVLATAGFALSSVDERKDSAGMTSDTSQIFRHRIKTFTLLSEAKNDSARVS
jgi:hypothetical protein